MIHVPEEWRSLLKTIREVAPEAILAGGALRDLDHGRPVKDLDIFLQPYDLGAVTLLLASEGFSLVKTFDGSYADAAKDVVSAWKATRPGHIEVNLIELRDAFGAMQAIERMDFGICQIAYDGDTVMWTEEYEEDKARQVITLTRADTVEGFKWSMRRYARLSEKYRWPLVVPAGFAHFQAEAEGLHVPAMVREFS